MKKFRGRKIKRKHSKIIAFLQLITFLFLFVFSLILIKETAKYLGGGIFKFLRSDMNFLNALGFGWLSTILLQASGAATSAIVALNSANIFSPSIIVFIVLGTAIGTSITEAIASMFFFKKKRRDFRHGFEIALVNLFYIIPIIIFMSVLELSLHTFSNLGLFLTDNVNIAPITRILNSNIIVLFLINNLMTFKYKILLIFLGLALLGISINRISPSLLKLLGEDNARRIINRYLNKKYSSFFIGIVAALFFFGSTSITITLLVPLVVSRLTNLKKIVPYIIGANFGGMLDALIGGLVIGKSAVLAIMVYALIGVFGLFWLFYTDKLFSITKYFSKRIFHVSKDRAFLLILGFILIALILTLFPF